MTYALLSYLLAILIFGLPTCAWADEVPACQREPGRVVCTEAGFTLLSDAMLDFQKRLDACQAQPPAAPVVGTLPDAAAAPAVSASRPLAGLGAGIGSTLLLTVAVLVPMPTELRAGLSSLALSGLATSVYLVLP